MACARYGTSYSAVRVLAAVFSAASDRQSFSHTVPGFWDVSEKSAEHLLGGKPGIGTTRSHMHGGGLSRPSFAGQNPSDDHSYARRHLLDRLHSRHLQRLRSVQNRALSRRTPATGYYGRQQFPAGRCPARIAPCRWFFEGVSSRRMGLPIRVNWLTIFQRHILGRRQFGRPRWQATHTSRVCRLSHESPRHSLRGSLLRSTCH